MVSLERVLYKLRADREVREAAFEKAVETFPAVYTPDANGKSVFLDHLYAAPVAPPAGAAANTPPRMPAEQMRICDLAQDLVESHSSAGSGMGKAVLGILLAVTAYAGINMVSDVKGNEPHAVRRQWDYQVKNQNWRNTNHGQDAPWYKPEEEIVEELEDERKDGESGIEGLAALGALVLGALGLYAFMKRK